MQIAVNGRFEGRLVRGVDRYAREVTRRLGSRVRIIRPRKPTNGLAGHLWEQFILPRLLTKSEVLWSPANSGPLGVSDQVVTIHDASVFEHPEWFSPAFALWYRFMLPRVARRARRVLTVSEHSRRALMRALGLPAEKVLAVHHGLDLSVFRPCESESVRRKNHLPERYVLFVGSLDPRKNIERLLLAWERLPDLEDLALVIAGCGAAAFGLVRRKPAQDRLHYLGYVPEGDLPGLYAGALCLILPSLDEGFGLPVLEAMACGTPVLASTAGALPEVTDKAALHFDPLSVAGIADAIRTAVKSEEMRQDLRQKGLTRARAFSWEKTADMIWEVLAANG